MASHTRVWEETSPTGTEDVSLGDDRIRNLKVDVGERLEDLLCGFNASDGTGDEATPGVKVLNFKEQASIATPSANQINVAAKEGVDGDAKGQLWAEDEDGNERQLTKTSGSALRLNVKAGDYAADSIDEDDIRLTNNANLTGRNNAGDGDINIVKVNTSDEVEVGEDGTTIVKLADGSKLASNAAPGGETELVNQKYVDDQNTAQFASGGSIESIFGTRTNLDSESNPLAKDEVYKVGSDGFVEANSNGNARTNGYTDGSNPPTTLMHTNFGSAGTGSSITMLVRKDDYFKVTRGVGGTTTTIYWLPIGTGTCVKQA